MPVTDNHRKSEATHRLDIGEVFDSLASNEIKDGQPDKVYAHHLARACWHGGRIILRQTSPEAEGIFDFTLELHKADNGRWNDLRERGVDQDDIDSWLDFAGLFLSSLGNYFGDGDRKVIPGVSKVALRKMASISPEASAKLKEIIDPMMKPVWLLSWPGMHYKEEIEVVTKLMAAKKIAPENTRLQKQTPNNEGLDMFEILQASVERDPEPQLLEEVMIRERHARVVLCRGDHAVEMTKICAELSEACRHTTNQGQKTAFSQLIESFRTGDYEVFRSAHKTWVTDNGPRVEHCMGFLFGYHDPSGARAEWQAASGVAHSKDTAKLNQLVQRSSEFIRALPWATPCENNGKGPFEPSELDVPDFAVIHILASVSSTVWEATNITVDEHGKWHWIKSMVYGNRMKLNNSPNRPCYYVHHSEAEVYMSCAHEIRFVGTAIHELIGHGTGKLLVETAPGEYNFDHENLPISPVTYEPITTWFRLGETYNSVFGKLVRTVEECRAFLTADYLVDNRDILALFGYDQGSTPTADDFIYYMYLQIGVQGLLALRSFNIKEQTWGGDHDRAQFAILKHILQEGDGVIWIECDPDTETLIVRVERSKIISHGKPSVGRMLCKINIWHSTADINACRPFYEALSVIDGEYETWRRIVASNPEPKWKFVQPNILER
ncbi:dipeptidyl peptidase III [Bisporella sp. PMI_857]|nr:dipeptidyl peptidase III [Bisporella sp. PMI_857]